MDNHPLSDRELQVIELVASGLKNEEISQRLEISKRTVDNHISNHSHENRHGQSGRPRALGLGVGLRFVLTMSTVCTLPEPGEQSLGLTLIDLLFVIDTILR